MAQQHLAAPLHMCAMKITNESTLAPASPMHQHDMRAKSLEGRKSANALASAAAKPPLPEVPGDDASIGAPDAIHIAVGAGSVEMATRMVQ